MKKVVIASKNPVKSMAVEEAFSKVFPEEKFEFIQANVSSGVSDQPMSDKETFQGAKNRVENALKKFKGADFYVGIEGGVEQVRGEMEAFAWVFIKSAKGKSGKAKTATFFLPKIVVQLIQEGKELGEADDIVFNRVNSKQDNGAVGILTNNVINRKKYYISAVILALIPFKNTSLY